MIGNFIVIRAKHLFIGLKNPWKIVLHLFLFCTGWGYGHLFAGLTNKVGSGEISTISPETLINYTLMFIACITLIRMVMPVYKPQRQVLPKFYPLTRWECYCLSIVSDFQTSYFFYIALFIATGFWNLEYSKFTFLYSAISVLFSTHLFRRMLHYIIENKLKVYGYVYFTTTILGISILILFSDSFLYYLNYLSLVVPIFLFIVGYLLECQIIESKNIELATNASKGYYLFKLLFNNKKVRLPLSVGLLLKLLILVVDLVMFTTKGKHIFDGQFVYWLFASPIVVFTYIFNNTWGFWKNVWLNFELRSGMYRDLIKFNMRLMAIPLIIDALITLPILMCSWHLYQFIIVFYFMALIFLIGASFVWSLFFPIVIRSTFQMKGSSSPAGSIVTLIFVVLLSVIQMNDWFYLLIPIYLIMSFVAYKLAMDLYKSKKYLLAKKLMKE